MRLKALKYLGLSAVLAEPLGWREWCTLAEDDTLFEAGFVMARNQRPPTHKLELVAWQKHKPAPAHLLKITYCSHWLLILSFLFHTFFCSHFVCHSVLSQGLYCDIRQLVQFIKEAHGNVFRRVALSALLDSAEKVTATKKSDEKEETKQPGPRRYTQWLETVLMWLHGEK